MIQKYIIAEVEHYKKCFILHETFLKFDKTKSSLIIDDDYVKNDMEINICYVYSLLKNMVNAGIYSSIYSAERAIKNKVLRAQLVIVYMTDINKAAYRYHYQRNECKSLEDLDKYCSGIQYVYDMLDKSITRYELYGDPLLGDNICRPISDLTSK